MGGRRMSTVQCIGVDATSGLAQTRPCDAQSHEPLSWRYPSAPREHEDLTLDTAHTRTHTRQTTTKRCTCGTLRTETPKVGGTGTYDSPGALALRFDA